jgi:hypothetical protein
MRNASIIRKCAPALHAPASRNSSAHPIAMARSVAVSWRDMASPLHKVSSQFGSLR